MTRHRGTPRITESRQNKAKIVPQVPAMIRDTVIPLCRVGAKRTQFGPRSVLPAVSPGRAMFGADQKPGDERTPKALNRSVDRLGGWGGRRRSYGACSLEGFFRVIRVFRG